MTQEMKTAVLSKIRKAERAQSKLRLALTGTSGSGKTYSSLLIAKGLGGKILVVDTENGSADLYANIAEYDVLPMNAPYTPEKYIAAIQTAEEAGYSTVILDSLSHAWAGEGGLLDQQGKIADKSGNGYTAWRNVTPSHNRLVDAIIQSKIHVIATMRSKQEYVMDKSENGKTTIKKVGLAPIQRDGVEYEFTTVFDLNQSDKVAHVSKDRTQLFSIPFRIDENTGKQLVEWLSGDKK
jgi:hypothetical protein